MKAEKYSEGGAYAFGPKGILYSLRRDLDGCKTICGLCDEHKASAYWPTDLGYLVHEECLLKITDLKSLIEEKLRSSLPRKTHTLIMQKAQILAFSHLRPYLEKKSIISYYEASPKELEILLEKTVLEIIKAFNPK